MRILVVGGSGSGKSAFAEQLACQLGPQRIYIATMADRGHEARTRIERHRRQRAGFGFETLECRGTLPLEAFQTRITTDVVLLDDLGNLVADALFPTDGVMADPLEVLERLEREVVVLSRTCRHLVIVGNMVGSEGHSSYHTTEAWVRLIGSLCCHLAARFDTVVEVGCGVPTLVKGCLP